MLLLLLLLVLLPFPFPACPIPDYDTADDRPDEQRAPWAIDIDEWIVDDNFPYHRYICPRGRRVESVFVEKHAIVELEKKHTRPAEQLDLAATEDES